MKFTVKSPYMIHHTCVLGRIDLKHLYYAKLKSKWALGPSVTLGLNFMASVTKGQMGTNIL